MTKQHSEHYLNPHLYLVRAAGGLATYLHADAVRSYLPQAIKFKAFPDAG